MLNYVLRMGCEKMLEWDLCLGHKSCEQQTLYELFGIKMLVLRQSFHIMQPTKGRVFFCDINNNNNNNNNN